MQKIEVARLRDYTGHLTNTDIWDSFALRHDDVFVCTPPKCGTSWTLNIVMMLIFGRVVPDAGNRDNAPWLDAAFRDRPAMAAFLDALDRRRCIKTHTPLDGIAYAAEPTYIVVYRHPVDVHFSFRSHFDNMKEGMKSDGLRALFPADERAGFARFVEAPLTDVGTDDLTVASLVDHYRQARARAEGGNVHFFHYADLTRDLRGQIGRLARIMHLDLSPQVLDAIAEANTFASMKKVVEVSDTRFDAASPFVDQAAFFASGTSNKWQGRLEDADLDAYADRMDALLPPDDVAWLNWGDTRAG